MITNLLLHLTKSNILWFLLDFWPLKNPCASLDPTLFFHKCKQKYWDILKEVKTLWILVGASNSGHSMIAYLLRQLTKSNILWFVLDLWHLKILAPTWTQIYFFFQKCKQQYWDKLNKVKTPWVHVGAANSKHIKSAYRTVWTYPTSYVLCIGIKKMFRKLLKILNQQDPNFFLFVLLELWFVYHFPRFLQFFDVGAQS